MSKDFDMTQHEHRQPRGWVRSVAVRGGILVGMMFGALSAFAQSVPVDRHEGVSLTYDLSQSRGDWIFRPQQQAHYTPGDIHGSRTSFVCRSAVDTTVGACATVPENLPDGPPTVVMLRFTEQRSKHTVDLGLTARKVVTVSGSTCTHRLLPFNTDRNLNRCAGRPYDVSRYLLTIPAAELARLPVGGIWRGRFEFDLREVGSTGASATHSYDIELNVTDTQNAQIYFPTLSNTAPRVAMDLQRRPGVGFRPLVFGGRSVDICYYDGFGSNSTGALRVRAASEREVFPPPSTGNGVLIRQDTNGSQPQQRIEYRLGMNYAGAYQWLRIGDAGGTAFGAVSQAPIRIVRLPGMPVAVACTPAALAFEIVPFLESEKDAGRYDGRIRIEMFVDAAGI
ncbi:CFA/I fimbrial subunit E [Pandoraea sputorum]|uniref:Colonization factor antigen I subunit E n=2 Tax=Pandoraea sputorum TaxID=93222 RepID=A0A239SR82_9BURK|nr:hypothetical protein NA29_24275 [Pandoraea sputorum]SNU87991.1 Colonization factor antigen I subunit E [Pandoraea sputorum]VVE52343.1 CFA/I fimbrial subunit E [Pandoraea sputorum]